MKCLSIGNGVVIDVWATKAIIESVFEEIKMNTWFVTDIKYTRAQQDIVIVVLFCRNKPLIGHRHTDVTFSNISILIVKYTVIVKIITGSKLIIIVRIVVNAIISHHH